MTQPKKKKHRGNKYIKRSIKLHSFGSVISFWFSLCFDDLSFYLTTAKYSMHYMGF